MTESRITVHMGASLDGFIAKQDNSIEWMQTSDTYEKGKVIRIVIIPMLLGDGTLFFDYIGQELPLHLKEVTPFRSGLVELWYELRKDSQLSAQD